MALQGVACPRLAMRYKSALAVERSCDIFVVPVGNLLDDNALSSRRANLMPPRHPGTALPGGQAIRRNVIVMA